MKEYIIVCWQPLSDDNRISYFQADTLAQAKKLANEKRKEFYDLVIISKKKRLNTVTKELEDVYTFEKFGYYRIYQIVNIILSAILLSVIGYFVYLYYHFVNHKT